jgi:hypothetical protein
MLYILPTKYLAVRASFVKNLSYLLLCVLCVSVVNFDYNHQPSTYGQPKLEIGIKNVLVIIKLPLTVILESSF